MMKCSACGKDIGNGTTHYYLPEEYDDWKDWLLDQENSLQMSGYDVSVITEDIFFKISDDLESGDICKDEAIQKLRALSPLTKEEKERRRKTYFSKTDSKKLKDSKYTNYDGIRYSKYKPDSLHWRAITEIRKNPNTGEIVATRIIKTKTNKGYEVIGQMKYKTVNLAIKDENDWIEKQ